MANPNFTATMSSNEIWRDLDDTRCITDDLDTIESNITALQTGKANSDHTHNAYAPSSHGHSYNDLTDKPTIPGEYTHPNNHPASMITGLATVATTGNYDDLNGKPTIPTIPSSLPANGGNSDTVDGKHANDFASNTHNHDTEYISKALQFVKDTGDVEFSFNANSNKNILTEIVSWGIGLHTAYAVGGTAGNPNTTDSFRFLVHKTNASIGWVLAFGGQGTVYSNYVHNGDFRGWKCLNNPASVPLWSGASLLPAAHTITPSKTLSECNGGWILVWSDYDDDTSTANSFDQCTTLIPKKNAMGENWNGEGFMVALPRYADEEGNTDIITIKNFNVYNDKLVGKDKNKLGTHRRDIVLRAIYEF